jgi:hypothetical protein
VGIRRLPDKTVFSGTFDIGLSTGAPASRYLMGREKTSKEGFSL